MSGIVFFSCRFLQFYSPLLSSPLSGRSWPGGAGGFDTKINCIQQTVSFQQIYIRNSSPSPSPSSSPSSSPSPSIHPPSSLHKDTERKLTSHNQPSIPHCYTRPPRTHPPRCIHTHIYPFPSLSLFSGQRKEAYQCVSELSDEFRPALGIECKPTRSVTHSLAHRGLIKLN